MRLVHENIAQIYGVAYGCGRLPAIVMNFYQGTLVSCMEKHRYSDEEKMKWVSPSLLLIELVVYPPMSGRGYRLCHEVSSPPKPSGGTRRSTRGENPFNSIPVVSRLTSRLLVEHFPRPGGEMSTCGCRDGLPYRFSRVHLDAKRKDLSLDGSRTHGSSRP